MFLGDVFDIGVRIQYFWYKLKNPEWIFHSISLFYLFFEIFAILCQKILIKYFPVKISRGVVFRVISILNFSSYISIWSITFKLFAFSLIFHCYPHCQFFFSAALFYTFPCHFFLTHWLHTTKNLTCTF